MEITKSIVDRLLHVANDMKYEYSVFGIRIQEQEFVLGPLSHVSHVWVDGEDTGIDLNGVCAISHRFAEKVFLGKFPTFYFGDHAAIICGNDFSYGEDVGEIIISDPVVVDIIA